ENGRQVWRETLPQRRRVDPLHHLPPPVGRLGGFAGGGLQRGRALDVAHAARQQGDDLVIQGVDARPNLAQIAAIVRPCDHLTTTLRAASPALPTARSPRQG